MAEYEVDNHKKKRSKVKNLTEDTIRCLDNFPENHKLNNKKSKKEEHKWTKEIPSVSIAVVGSIIDNTQSQELATLVCYLKSQKAHTCILFVLLEIPSFSY